tara:strand:+ start:957 stop:1634 length:678 start_codon:yes stop_codon:yes gene_type:complete
MPLSLIEIEALKLSLRVSLWAVCLSLPLGILVAWVLSRKSFPGRVLIDGIVHLPLIVPPVVVGYILLLAFGRRGFIGSWLWETFEISISFSWKGAALAAGIMAFPLMVRSIRLGLDAVDPKLEQAAKTLGASSFGVFFSVTMPLILPSILTGAILAFARCLGEFGATITFVSNIPGETRTLPLALYTAVQSPGGEIAALRLVVISVVIALVALLISEFLSRKARK